MKIFGIGFHKTATTSLAAALKILGFKTVHGDPRSAAHFGDQGKTLIKMIKNGNYNLPTLDKYDAFTDNPYFSIWKELDSLFPGSKFILTVRDQDKWIKSCLKFFKGRKIRPLRRWLFGRFADPSKDQESKTVWLNAFNQHNREIITYFKNRPQDLLIMDITKGDGWNKLCPFLQLPVPKEGFPSQNRTVKKRKSMLYKIVRKPFMWFKLILLQIRKIFLKLFNVCFTI
ncbi:MAG: hypothetical protein JW822_01540 [Spirochaetales bacterium]|nr:hypothetical protein [Spirochaetales bacterium]